MDYGSEKSAMDEGVKYPQIVIFVETLRGTEEKQNNYAKRSGASIILNEF